ncbi:MAG TPA: FHA domain-containing protein [Kofleriaceae bacterium]|nr:FHA domain-containing protein [Kofleriaceae bacterium]
MSSATKTDLGVAAWPIDDAVVRLRVWGSDQCFALPGPDDAGELTLGSSEACSLALSDPSGRLSRQHARLAREAGRWVARDLASQNGLWLDGARRAKILLEPGSELGLGGLTLIADSPRLIALHGFVARVLGWADARREAVDLAVRALRLAATRHAALALCGESDGDLLAIARGLHARVLGADRSFVLCDPRRRAVDGASAPTGMLALAAAPGGSVVVWTKRLPRDFAQLTAAVREPRSRVQLIACGARPTERGALVSAPIEIPPLAARAGELDRLIDAYADDAIAALAVATPFTKVDRDWVRAHSASSLVEIEKGTARIVALRAAGNVARAASLLGMAHASLGEWIGRRRLPAGTLR